jgi:hypothetical protein
MRDGYSVKTITFHHWFVNKFSRGDDDVEEMVEEYLNNELGEDDEYFPLFFPALSVISNYGPSTISILFDRTPSEAFVQEALQLLDSTLSYSAKYEIMVKIAYRFSYKRFWISVLQCYKERLEDIIRNAPPTRTRMVLYRGVKSDYFIPKSLLEIRDRVHIAGSFVSTTSSVNVLQRFTTHDECCVMRIYVPIGTRMITLAGFANMDEAEFLLGPNTQFYITKTSSQKFCTNKYDLKMKVSDMVVIR